MILVDSNIILDLVTNDPAWASWSQARLDEAALSGPIVINDVVYAETSAGFKTMEHFDAMLDAGGFVMAPIPRAALFLAGKAFQTYRRAGGIRAGALPDFFIGAHAAVRGWPLLTRDARRYRGYFPTLELIAPD